MEDKKYITKKGKYLFNKWVFRIALGIIFVYCVILYFSMGINSNFNINCPTTSKQNCLNPIKYCIDHSNNIFDYTSHDCETYEGFVKSCRGDLCTQEYIQPGKHLGDLPPFYFRIWPYVMIIIVGLAFAVNHFVYNRRNEDADNT